MQMVPFVMANFYPNECFTCCRTKKQGSLKRCSRCQMISYCGEDHQKSHWPLHKDLCNAIYNIFTKRGWCHIYEQLKDQNYEKWIQERQRICAQVQNKVCRALLPCEQKMFLFPRACFICHESRQNMLIDCPRCPGATFCREHKSSPLHDSYCPLIAKCQDLDRDLNHSKLTPEQLTKLALTFIDDTPINNGSGQDLKLPTSMEEYLDVFIKPKVEIPSDYKIHASEYLCKALTIYNALQKVNYIPSYELTIYVGGLFKMVDLPKFWELLFHLLPEVTLLRIVSMDQEKTAIEGAKLCNECDAKNKLLLVENVDYGYPKMLDYKTKPNLVIFFNIDPPDEGQWSAPKKLWEKVNCPLAVATVNAKKGRVVCKTMREAFGIERIFVHDGENEFMSLRPRREWRDESAFMQNQYLVVCKSKEEIDRGSESITESPMIKWLKNH